MLPNKIRGSNYRKTCHCCCWCCAASAGLFRSHGPFLLFPSHCCYHHCFCCCCCLGVSEAAWHCHICRQQQLLDCWLLSTTTSQRYEPTILANDMSQRYEPTIRPTIRTKDTSQRYEPTIRPCYFPPSGLLLPVVDKNKYLEWESSKEGL